MNLIMQVFILSTLNSQNPLHMDAALILGFLKVVVRTWFLQVQNIWRSWQYRSFRWRNGMREQSEVERLEWETTVTCKV